MTWQRKNNLIKNATFVFFGVPRDLFVAGFVCGENQRLRCCLTVIASLSIVVGSNLVEH